jgi:predicted alpha/beta-hydrolase family hydrolase
MDSTFLAEITARIAKGGEGKWRVLRFEFPYMTRRRKTGSRRPPDRPEVLLESWRQVIAAHSPERLVIGGKSMGGRMASMVADSAGVAGLVCLGYPFHPPGKPEKTRTAYLRDLETPTLIVQGTRDPFGTRSEVAEYDLSPRIKLCWIEDGNHDLAPRKSSGLSREDSLAAAAGAATEFLTSFA